MKLSARMAAIERRLKPAGLGYKVFTQDIDNPDLFYGEAPGSVDYRRGVIDSDHPGERRYTRAEIDALKKAGWVVLLIVYTQEWRESDKVLATVRPEYWDKL